MGRKTKDQKNTLTIREVGPDRFHLTGYIEGVQIRRQGTLVEMEDLKAKKERGALEREAAEGDRHPLPESWISIAQLRDAEMAFHRLGTSKLTLAECVEEGLARLGNGDPVTTETALKDYLASLKERDLSPRHLANVKSRMGAFFEAMGVEEGVVSEIDTRMIEKYCRREHVAGYTKLTDAGVIRAFLSYCVYRTWLRSSPFALDMTEHKKMAEKGRKRPKILRAAQAEDLLKATVAADNASHVPFLLLNLWGGIRVAEVEKLTLEDIQFENGNATVAIRPSVSKTASYRDVYLPTNIIPLLKECIEAGILNNEPIGAVNQTIWTDIREKAGLIEVERTGEYSNRKITETNWEGNILRHSGLSYHFKRGGDIVDTARQAGHSETVSFKHYITLAKAEDVARFYSITASLTPADAQPKVA